MKVQLTKINFVFNATGFTKPKVNKIERHFKHANGVIIIRWDWNDRVMDARSAGDSSIHIFGFLRTFMYTKYRFSWSLYTMLKYRLSINFGWFHAILSFGTTSVFSRYFEGEDDLGWKFWQDTSERATRDLANMGLRIPKGPSRREIMRHFCWSLW